MPGYRKELSSHIEELLDQAERSGSCLAARDERLYRALGRRKRAGALVSPYPRLFCRKDTWLGLDRAGRALLVLRGVHDLHPGWVFADTSAALLLGLQVPFAELDGHVHVMSDVWRRDTSVPPVTWHRVRGDGPVEAATVPGMSQPVMTSTPLRTTFDCIRHMGLRHGTAIADSALRCGRFSKDELVDYVERRGRGAHGAKQARTTTRFSDGRSANGGESAARAAMHELGFAAPDLQVEFRDPIDPGRSYFADYVWGAGGASEAGGGGLVIGELDGIEKYFSPVMNRGEGAAGALLRERIRESRITITRAAIVRFSYQDVLDDAYFSHLLETFGVPRDHAPLVKVPARGAVTPDAEWERVPLEAYGV